MGALDALGEDGGESDNADDGDESSAPSCVDFGDPETDGGDPDLQPGAFGDVPDPALPKLCKQR